MNDKTIIARNLLILGQLRDIDEAAARINLELILLKGAALIELEPDYAARRVMDDADLLVRPRDRKKLKLMLGSLGYQPAPHDPNALFHPQKEAPIDISSEIFYTDKAQFERLWENSKAAASSFTSIFMLEPEELLVHLFAHAAVHHAEITQHWRSDIQLAESLSGRIKWDKFHEKIIEYGLKEAWDVFNGQLPSTLRGMFYKLLLSRAVPAKGFIAIFLYSRSWKKALFVAEELFPSSEFLKDRYGLRNRLEIFVFRVLRPLIILWEALVLFSRFLSRLFV